MPVSLFDLEITLRAAVSVRRAPRPTGCVDLFLAIVDHYEPQVGKPPRDVAMERVDDWLKRYPEIASKHRDAEGRVPAHGFFYPWDEFDAPEAEKIASLCHAGYGELEIHLHHRDDTDASVRKKLRDAVSAYSALGAFSRWPDGRPAWGFVHGNWALDNSRHEGGRNFCGVDNELTVLREEGCYADFTFPSWQKMTQPRMVNRIYYALDDPQRPKSYDWGVPARTHPTNPTDRLMLVHGPLVPHLRGGFRPGMDDGDLAASPGRRYSPERLDRWVRAGVHVEGRPEWVFIKLHCHGAQDANRAALLEGDLEALFNDAEARYNDGRRYRLHYVTAREMFNLVKAAEAGVTDVGGARDYVLPRGSL